jgi:hypothetical protein
MTDGIRDEQDAGGGAGLGPETGPGAAKVPEKFIDQTTQRYRNLPMAVRIYILAASFGGVASAVYYIFLPSPPLDLTYYFFLMAMYLPMAYLRWPTCCCRRTRARPPPGG